MTNNEMITFLSTRLEDESEDRFTEVMKLQYLNTAQHSLVNALDNGLLAELQTIDSTKSLAAGKYALTGYTTIILRQSIISVKLDEHFAIKVNVKNLKDTEHPDLAGTSTDPRYYILGNTLYGLGCSSTASIEIVYIKEASDITATDDEVTDINAAYHHLLLDYAEFLGWKSVKDARAGDALKQYFDKVNTLNKMYLAESSG